MFNQEFYNQYISNNALIQEGYAYAISAQWFRQFNSFLKNPNGANNYKIEQINNCNICDLAHEIQTHLDGYQIPQQYSMAFSRIYRLRPGVKYGQDYEIVSIQIWNYLKLCYNADYDVVVFVTKILPNLTNYFTCDNLDQGVCICNEVIYLILVIVHSEDKSLMMALKVPACPWLEFVKYRTFIFDMAENKLNPTAFINKAHLYYNGKKMAFQEGSKTLKDMEITKDMQIIISCQNLTLGEVDEEIETEEDEQQIEQNLHTKQEFLQILEQNLNQQSNEMLSLKSIQEIEQCLDQIDFFQV